MFQTFKKKQKKKVQTQLQTSVSGRWVRVLTESAGLGSAVGGGGVVVVDEIPLSGGRELHLQDFAAPLFITWLCQVGHH